MRMLAAALLAMWVMRLVACLPAVEDPPKPVEQVEPAQGSLLTAFLADPTPENALRAAPSLTTVSEHLLFLDYIRARKLRACGAAVVTLVKNPALIAPGTFDGRTIGNYAVEILVALEARDQAPALVALIAENRIDAAEALVSLHADVAPTIAVLLKSELSAVRILAARTLGRMKARGCAAEVAGLLKDPDIQVRTFAAEALGEMGAVDQVDALKRLLADDNARMRQDGAFALGRMRAPGCEELLAERLKDVDASVRGAAAYALGNLGALNRAGEIATLFGDADISNQCWAAKALAQLNQKDQAANIAKLLGSRSVEVRGVAAWALWTLDAREYCDDLRKLIDQTGGVWIEEEGEGKYQSIGAIARRAVEAWTK